MRVVQCEALKALDRTLPRTKHSATDHARIATECQAGRRHNDGAAPAHDLPKRLPARQSISSATSSCISARAENANTMKATGRTLLSTPNRWTPTDLVENHQQDRVEHDLRNLSKARSVQAQKHRPKLVERINIAKPRGDVAIRDDKNVAVISFPALSSSKRDLFRARIARYV